VFPQKKGKQKEQPEEKKEKSTGFSSGKSRSGNWIGDRRTFSGGRRKKEEDLQKKRACSISYNDPRLPLDKRGGTSTAQDLSGTEKDVKTVTGKPAGRGHGQAKLGPTESKEKNDKDGTGTIMPAVL